MKIRMITTSNMLLKKHKTGCEQWKYKDQDINVLWRWFGLANE